ncbi:MAG: formate dehydrogenase [Betaproteobacteria bacterium]
MQMTSMRAMLVAGLVVAMYGAALAKLPPAPALTDVQKQEAAAKKSAADAKDKTELTRAQDRAAQNYIAAQRAKGVTVTPQLPLGDAAASAEQQKTPSTKATPEKAMAHSPPKK